MGPVDEDGKPFNLDVRFKDDGVYKDGALTWGSRGKINRHSFAEVIHANL
ncbi:hypothetical protein HNR39_002255 [Glaciimonas immobilis]|uniref:Uncharacterized protein n=1 Tax=Glaciimonas immobilis TaxID=728004 RepID=A0A840RV94_9BURK|nr:hypothetical protein [Glaciimonas immobilis]